MNKKLFTGIRMNRDSMSYINSLHMALSLGGLFRGEKFMLSGMTGMAFKFNAVKGFSSVSLTSYGKWAPVNWNAVNHLGIINEAQAGRSRHRTFPLVQKHAIKDIIASLDKGMPVIYWIPAFGLIYGYDLNQSVFYYVNGDRHFARGYQSSQLEEEVLLFDNICRNQSGIWFYQVLGEKAEKPEEIVYLDSLSEAFFSWNHSQRSAEKASGLQAYDMMVEDMKGHDFDRYGAAYILKSYAVSKSEIYSYLNHIKEVFPGLAAAASLYGKVNDVFLAIKEMAGYENRYSFIGKEKDGKVIGFLQEAKVLETAAMKEVGQFLHTSCLNTWTQTQFYKWPEGEDR